MHKIVLSWSNAHLYGSLWADHHRLRHKLFIGRNQWDIPDADGMEYDSYDTPAARYILIVDDLGAVRAVTRLIPTTRPIMARDCWPDLLGDWNPQTDRIWEATRFGVDKDLAPDIREKVQDALILAVQEFGVEHDLSGFIGVMPKAFFRRIGSTGVPFEIVGGPVKTDQYRIFAAKIGVCPDAIDNLRHRLQPALNVA